MKKPHVFLLILGVAACIPCGIVSAQKPSAQKSDQADPLADVLLLSKNLGILSNLAAKLTESNPVVAALDGMVGKVTANVDEQKKQIAKLPAEKREVQRKLLSRLEGELDTAINRHAVLSDAVVGLKKQLAATEADAVVGALLKGKEARSLMDDKLKELEDAMQRLEGGATRTTDEK